ncbi:MAG TPA: ACT domain-containing protein, partial [Methanocorpusculum sp.]|nr:ACT domain-containing protein [Methanocorpusculum sp.]
MTNEYIIKQLSIFAPNTPGTLAEIAKIFQDNGVNISAF